jgi:hypothetical protein
MEGLDSGGQGPTSGCCAVEEEEKHNGNRLDVKTATPGLRYHAIIIIAATLNKHELLNTNICLDGVSFVIEEK